MENRAADRQHGLLEVIFGHLLAVAAVGEIVVQARALVLVHLKLKAEAFCKRLLCKIIAGGAETAGGDDDIRPAFRNFNAIGKPCGVIADNGVVLYIYADLREHLRNVACVGVYGMT